MLNITTFSELINIIVLEEWENKLFFYLLKHVETSGELDLCRAAELMDAHTLLVELWGSCEMEWGKAVRPCSGGEPWSSVGEFMVLLLPELYYFVNIVGM